MEHKYNNISYELELKLEIAKLRVLIKASEETTNKSPELIEAIESCKKQLSDLNLELDSFTLMLDNSE